ncbi:unnamed protein product [Oikopleura dioica]|uniref:C2H2-type domain-containing protein n=1 Tax=Oikopleura dioica TaxID=34765 RepID=E4YUM3_OIKDI|nr:unnamed protein product [Oikopleura dioica]
MWVRRKYGSPVKIRDTARKYTFTMNLEAPTLKDLADEHLDMDYPSGEYHDAKEEARTVMKIFAKDYMSFETSINPEEEEKERKKNFVKQEKKTAYFYCKYCDVAMNSVEQEDAHLDGKKHRKKRKQYNKLHGIVEDTPPRRKKVTPPRYDSRSRSRSRGRGRSYSRSYSRSRSRSFSRSRSRSRGRTRSRSRSYSRGRSFTPPRKRKDKSKKRGRSISREYEEYGKRSPEKAKKKDKMKVPPVPQFNRFGERISEVARLPSEERMGTVCGSPPRARPKLKDRTPPRKRHRTPPRSKGSKRQKHRYSSSESSSEESSSSEDTDSDNSTTTIYTRKRYAKKKKSKR